MSWSQRASHQEWGQAVVTPRPQSLSMSTLGPGLTERSQRLPNQERLGLLMHEIMFQEKEDRVKGQLEFSQQ